MPANTGDGTEQTVILSAMVFGMLLDKPFYFRKFSGIEVNDVQINIDVSLHRRISKAIPQLFSSKWVAQIKVMGRKVILTEGIGDMSFQISPMSDNTSSAAQQIAR
ncbi:hypothetical protein GCM10007414_39820 [Agarivorans gilvus]|uniref:DUF304 domain-containing protein n=1 Tax=Agarivorans gilvus TaxID=680279 RepID=A0ABQ1I6W9_9ALTE|nr:hypothetical protein GCM10007414_39820 [Agarivorans gilvus]